MDGGWQVVQWVVGRVGVWVHWLIEVVGFLNGFTSLFLRFEGAAGGNVL